ncbi:efflux RND transporter periplasmic adaptor subunit [Cellulosimicrobium protaetiae]|uniref:Efflux RND transporter periplasmic adaptor subunit n=1 Tax=Cellulosimicrobium protaetiae TaxID=2587808 RepID=A0A6M5UFZ6_9MICO|nr:peptidoglycan-binding protein [Cellulosimicrobium protaetiae]QJW35529.1 efflux RND transporter periplasmic adaptor subunit [Cellulosimicrobium protaetiae]
MSPRPGGRATVARRAGWAVLGAATLAGLGLVAAAADGFGFGPSDGPVGAVAPATTEVTRQDLVATTEEPGEVGLVGRRTLRAASGVVTWLPVAGAVVGRGEQLYRVDEVPTVLLLGDLPAYRTLQEGVSGPDVRQLEENLAALGRTGFDVDDRFTSATAVAVRAWQADLGVARTGVVEPGVVHYAPDAVLVADLVAEVGDDAAGDLVVVAGQERVVTVDLDPRDARFAVAGATVSVTLPDGSVLPATVARVETVVVPGPPGVAGEEDGTTVLRATVTPDDPAALAGDDAPVASTARVAFAADRRDDVLTVPVAALLALAEGGYAVERVDDGGTALVAVETGLFADGRVEVSGAGLAAGDRVVVPG